jgi:hypothetical protein
MSDLSTLSPVPSPELCYFLFFNFRFLDFLFSIGSSSLSFSISISRLFGNALFKPLFESISAGLVPPANLVLFFSFLLFFGNKGDSSDLVLYVCWPAGLPFLLSTFVIYFFTDFIYSTSMCKSLSLPSFFYVSYIDASYIL